jgi:hypothetical protein
VRAIRCPGRNGGLLDDDDGACEVTRDAAGGVLDSDKVGFAGGSRRRADAHEEDFDASYCRIRLGLESQSPGGDLFVSVSCRPGSKNGHMPCLS